MGSRNLNIYRLIQSAADVQQSLSILREYAAREASVFLNNLESVRSSRYASIVMVEAGIGHGKSPVCEAIE